MMEPVLTTFESYCGMCKFWPKVRTMEDTDGSLKYLQLLALMRCVLSFSHGNAAPERDFSMNKIMLESDGYIIGNDIIAALRLVKDSVRKEAGVHKFPITGKLLNYTFKSFVKY